MRRVSLLASLLMVLSLLTACGATSEPEVVTEIAPGATSQAAPATKVPDATEPSPTAASELQDKAQEVILIESIPNDALTLSPNIQFDTGGSFTTGNVYSTLVILDWCIAAGVTPCPYGDLAESWEIDADYRVYTFHLRENATWHDGVPVTAADVKYTYDTMIEKEYPFASFLANVKEISTPDDYTVVIELNNTDVSFVPMMGQAANWYGKIMPKHIWEGTEWDQGPYVDKPIGSGPFKFVEWERANHVTLEAYDDYFLGRGVVDRIILQVIPDKNVAQAEFYAGNTARLPYDYAPTFGELESLRADPSIEVIGSPSHYSRDLLLNVTREPLNNVKVREAIAHAINRDEINQKGFFGLGAPSRYVGVPGMPTYLNTEAMFPDYDPVKAEELLDEAGYPRGADGWRFSLSIINPIYADSKIISEITVQQLKAVGINARWDQLDQTAWKDKVWALDYDMTGYYVRYGPDPDAYREHFGTGQARNLTGYSNSEFDALAEQARQTVDIQEREKLYDQLQEILVRDIPYINVVQETKITLVHTGWQGFPEQESGFGKSLGWFSYYAVTPPQ